MQITRFIVGCGMALWAMTPLVAMTNHSSLYQAVRAATSKDSGTANAERSAAYQQPRVSSFAPRPVTASPAQLDVVLPPSPALAGNHASPPRITSVSHAATPHQGSNATAAAGAMPVVGANVPEVAALPYTPTTAALTSQLLPAVQRGYSLAERGALYAARTEFVQVLRRVAQAKDATIGSDLHSRALAAGLRALDEAEDFIPTGTQLEGDANVWVIASSHRTAVLQYQTDDVSLHQAASLYHAFAERQLATAVSGEQAGSMALHGLGKINARLALVTDNDVQHVQSATAMFSAALAARPDNHLAANELGVLLCRNGRPVEAARLFEKTIDFAPSATAYHNLAVAQRKLGMHGQSAANEQESQRLAAWERNAGAVSQRAGVRWIAPADMARVAQPAPLAPKADVARLPRMSPWKKTAELAKSLPLPGIDWPKDAPRQPADPPRFVPFVAPPLPSQSQLR